jgi:hypothetical protein
MTKNELYSRLTFEGVARGYEVICEYAIQSEERKILLDLVWVRRRNTDGPIQNAPNPAFWRLIAAFEIEGCNVPLPTPARPNTEFQRHLINFEIVRSQYQPDNPHMFVVLYTAAYDRSRWPQYNGNRVNALVQARTNWNQGGIAVIDGRNSMARLAEIFGPIPLDGFARGHWAV